MTEWLFECEKVPTVLYTSGYCALVKLLVGIQKKYVIICRFSILLNL